MKTFTQPEPLIDAELDRLGDFLKSCKGGKAMNVVVLDGFFAALIAGPETVMPSEYYREVFGGEMSDACQFGSLDEANEILGLLMRHWNDIAATLNKDEVYVPLLLEDEDGMAHGNDWARGFMQGMHMRHDGWAELMDDEEHGGCLVPMMMLFHERDEDPKMRPEPINPEKREQIKAHMTAGLLQAYRYFRSHRQVSPSTRKSEPWRSTPKVGWNHPCPCGSGKKKQEMLRRGNRELTSSFPPESSTTLSALDTIPAEGNHAVPWVAMGKFSPTTRNSDCEEIANASTAYGRRRRNWIDAQGSVPPRQVVDASCGNEHCVALRHSYLRPRVDQPRKYGKIADRVHRLRIGQHFDVHGVGTDERSRNRFRCGLYAAARLDKVSVRGQPDGSVRVTKVGEWRSLRV